MMLELIEKINKLDNCKVFPAQGLPFLGDEHSLPKDIKEFYTYCGGIKFFYDSDYSIEIVSPDKFLLSNPVILPKDWEKDLPKNDISKDWYIIAESGVEQKISIDLNKKRVGRCYDSFWDIHASPGSCPIIAESFIKLLESLFFNNGEYWYWLKNEFEYLGDAYD